MKLKSACQVLGVIGSDLGKPYTLIRSPKATRTTDTIFPIEIIIAIDYNIIMNEGYFLHTQYNN